jgi:RNA polymerase-binding protein DksA
MEQMTQKQITHLEGVLVQRKLALREDIHRELGIKDDYVEVATEAPDPGDASFADLSVDLGNAAVGRDLNELRAIDAAQARMSSGTYGECLECGYEIPYERLEVQPTAERCAPCQEIYEKTHADPMRGSSM